MATFHVFTPAPRGSRKGNRASAERYARLLRQHRHRVRVLTGHNGARADLAIAVHAGRSAAAMAAFARDCPGAPRVVMLSGTDVYGGLGGAAARRCLDSADRIILLQPLAERELPTAWQRKAVTIYQSATPPARPPARRGFELLTVAHLRTVKDPLRAARAVRLLPPELPVRAVLVGGVIEPRWEALARAEQAANPRFDWLGELAPARTLRRIAGAALLVVPSRAEGGANVIAEACVCGTPVLASRVPGNVGMLGTGYAGFFEYGDTRGLVGLIRRCYAEPGFLRRLRHWCARRAKLFAPARERRALVKLVQSLIP